MNPNWFETFFEGLALDMWRGAMMPEQTAREVRFLADHLELQPEMCVLDVPCGNGRHAIELARQGVRMTGVDISAGFLEEARRNAPEVEWVQSDMRNIPSSSRFDAAYCWGNSFGYFDHDNCQKFLNAVAAALKPGALFLLESGAVSESILPGLQPERRLQIGGLDFSSRNTYDAADGRMDITYTFTRGERREVKPIHQWVHSAAELRRMLARSGLEPLAQFGDLEGGLYALGSARFIALARRTRSQ
jgi:cyclopropane fatty-acyl-phospholipid synthase-like methyltransferase